MIPRIEQEVVIDAPIEVVWHVLTEPGEISRWFADEVEIDVRPGGEGRLVWTERGANGPGGESITVETVQRPHLFSFRWAYPEGVRPGRGNSVLVEFTLTAEGEGTRLRVTERELEETGWSDERKTAYAEDHLEGWLKHLYDLSAYAVRKGRTFAR